VGGCSQIFHTFSETGFQIATGINNNMIRNDLIFLGLKGLVKFSGPVLRGMFTGFLIPLQPTKG
jgi:hypothetical protein